MFLHSSSLMNSARSKSKPEAIPFGLMHTLMPGSFPQHISSQEPVTTKTALTMTSKLAKVTSCYLVPGRGAIHMEETGQKLKDEGGLYHGFQIWLNMPAKYKWIDPSTMVYREKHMDIIDNDQYYAKVVLGELHGAKSGVELLSPAFYYHIHIKPEGRMAIPTNPGHNAFVYSINGDVELEGRKMLKTNKLALYERGDSVIDLYSECGAELLVMGGQPLNEPVYSYGPFVMNTEDEIKRCISNYRKGLMGNPDVVNQ